MIRWCVEHKTIVLLLSVMILAGGIFVYSDLERQENPTITPPIALVQCIYPGASPEDVEKQIIKPIEEKIGEIENIKTIESFSLDSVGIIKITLEDMSDAAILRHWEKVKDKIDDVKAELPDSAEAPTVDTELINSFGLVVGLSSSDYTNQDIQRVAKILEKKVSKIDGVAEVKLMGEVNSEISVQLDMTRLNQYGISANTIMTAIKARNVSIPGGNLEMEKGKIPVQITGEYQSIEELRNTIVGVSEDTGLPIRLRELAQVEMKDEMPDSYSLIGNQKAVLVGVRYMSGTNVLKTGEAVDKILEEFREDDLYRDMKMTILTNQPEYVDDAIDLFVNNLASAIILVIAIVWIFMGFRSAVVVSVPIAVVTSAVLLYMKLAAIPLHQISIASLIISLSLLVANGIVANDNMYLYLQQGRSRKEAVIQGVKDVNIPILTSTLTTIASFLPLAMMQGSAGKFASALPVLVSVALFASYFTALTLVPAMGDRILEVKSRSGGLMDKFVHKLRIFKLKAKLEKAYDKFLEKSLAKPRRTILMFVVLLGLSFTLVPTLGMQVFPPIQRDQYVLTVTLPSGVSLDYTRDVAAQIAQAVDGEESVQSTAVQVGDGFIQYYDTFASARRGTNVAEYLINGDRDKAYDVAGMVESRFPEATVNLKFLELNMPQDQPVQIRISGSDITELKRIAESVNEEVKLLDGVNRTEINYGFDSYKLKINVDETKANLTGITNYDVASTVRMAVNGMEVTEIKQQDIDKDSIPVVLRIGRENLLSIEDMNRIFITSQITAENVPLSQIAELKTESSLNQIVRRNEDRTITVGLYLNKNVSSEIVLHSAMEKLKTFTVPSGYTLSYGGDNEFAEETFGSMVVPAIMAIVLIYLIITLQFGKLVEPLIIMGTIPLSFIGIISGLKIMNYPIGFMAMLGAISLMGVVVNNGIVLLDYIKLLQNEGNSLHDAVVTGAKTRLRPIMIGMVTTVISLIPLMISGGPLWQPLATAINFGLLFSTALTLIVIPCAYLWIETVRLNRRSKKKVTV